MSGRVTADDAVDSIPIGTVGLIPVHYRQVGHHHINLVLWHFPRKLQSRTVGREVRRRLGKVGGSKDEEEEMTL